MPKVWSRRPEVLLCPTVPKPLHQVNPRSILGGPWWNKTRKEAYASTNQHCLACGVHRSKARWVKWLEGHEYYEVDYLAGRLTYVETLPLCHLCHNFIHSGRLESLFQQGEISAEKYIAVLQHGDRVLRLAGLTKPQPYTGPSVPWLQWRLVLFDKLYPPKFQDEKEWLQAHGY